MELVQAPPLHAIGSLTNDFKVADESLAGVVRDDIKVFSTTIRPRSENVTQIPPIPFSFFDPNSQKFVTVNSDPILVEVNKAETLALDSIVGRGKGDSTNDSAQQTSETKAAFNLENQQSNSILSASTPFAPSSWWWMALIPPGFWGFVTFWKRSDGKSTSVGREIKNSQTASALAEAVQRAVQSSSDNGSVADSLQRTVPTDVSSDLRNQIRDFYDRCDQAVYSGTGASLTELKCQAKQVVENLPRRKSNRLQTLKLQQPMRTLASCGLAAAVTGAGIYTLVQSVDHSPVATQATSLVSLDQQQKTEILKEASDAYNQGQALLASDVVESKLAFESASDKYQLLADSGVRNSQLYCNLGNAYLQQGKLGKAIANYETARRYNPADTTATHNLSLAKQQIDSGSSDSATTGGSVLADIGQKAIAIIPPWSAWTLFGAGWLAFWAVAAGRQLSWSIPQTFSQAMVGTSVAMILMAGGLIVAQDRTFDALKNPIAVVTDEAVDVRIGCGEEFQPATGFELAEGTALRVLQLRGDWCQVENSAGSKGWVRSSDVELVADVSSNDMKQAV